MPNNPIFLIVDDSHAMRIMLKNIIEANIRTCTILEAEDGIEAIKKFKEFKPNLVTLDMNMPKIDGIKTLKAIKEIDAKANVIIVSVEPLEHLPEDVIKIGIVDYITKPFDRTVVAPKIMRALKLED